MAEFLHRILLNLLTAILGLQKSPEKRQDPKDALQKRKDAAEDGTGTEGLKDGSAMG
jgi:hypothetical protein